VPIYTKLSWWIAGALSDGRSQGAPIGSTHNCTELDGLSGDFPTCGAISTIFVL
jgi:hypothetical protein